MRLFDDEKFEDEEFFKDTCDELQNGLVSAINTWNEKKELRIVIVEGATGIGKSLYALLVASQVYNTKSWNVLKKYFVYERKEFIDIIKSKRRINGLYVRKPLLVWDDAGNWLHAQDYQKKEVIDVCRYFTVARSQWSCIMLTAPDAEDIVRRIRDIKYRILVQIIKNTDKKTHQDRRMARFFIRWKSPDKTRKGEDTQIYEEFYLHECPHTLYDPYEIYRNDFVEHALKEL